MKRQVGIILAFIILLALPATSFTFPPQGDINKYISYDNFKVVPIYDDESACHPRLKGRFINQTDEDVSFEIHIYFCGIDKKRFNSVTIDESLQPKGKIDFYRRLIRLQCENAKNAHHLEFEFESLTVGGENMLKESD